jgi:hypothetical protein
MERAHHGPTKPSSGFLQEHKLILDGLALSLVETRP